MRNTTVYDTIKFNKDSKQLSIELNGNSVLGPFDLTKIAVKLAVVKVGEQFEVSVETSVDEYFETEYFESKIVLDSETQEMNLFFDVKNVAMPESNGNNSVFDIEGERYHLSIIGAEDIRNNLVPPTGLFLMERQILSLYIVNNILKLNYHSSITPN